MMAKPKAPNARPRSQVGRLSSVRANVPKARWASRVPASTAAAACSPAAGRAGSETTSAKTTNAENERSAPNHHTARQPKALSSGWATLNVITFPTGTQVAHRPMGMPRSRAPNHMLIAAGATTEIRPTLMPSMMRPASSMLALVARAPTTEPATAQPRASRPVALSPSRVRKKAVGMARSTPARE
jgi:hypothetical protein